MRRQGALALAGLLAAVVNPGCSDHPATALVVALSSEAAVPDEVDAVSIEVKRGDRITFAQRYVVNKTTHEVDLPGTLTLEPLEDESLSSTVRISIRAEQHQQQVSLRSATMAFVKERQKLVRMVIRYSCLDFPQACGDGQTCLGGTCGSDTINTAKLPDFGGGTAFPTVSQGNCFDTSDKVCGKDLEEVDAASLVASNCQVDVSSQGSTESNTLNVFAFWKERVDQGHAVVLDQDPPDLPAGQPGEGWSPVSSTSFRLTDGLCDLVKSGSLLRVGYNFACETKKLEKPICVLDPGTVTTLNDSLCVQCTYFNTEDDYRCVPSSYASGDQTPQLFADALACPFDSKYETPAECQASQACFFDRLDDFLGCQGEQCKLYEGADAWRTCLSGKREAITDHCKVLCQGEGVGLCYVPTGGP